MKLAVISGASSGIGEATARALARQDYRVVLIARNRSRLEAIAASIGEQAVVKACDAADGDAVLAAAERVLRDYGIPDVVVNAAGAGEWKRIEHTTPAESVDMMRAPYFAAFNLTHAFMAPMLGRGSGVILHVGSPVSIFTWPSCTGYAAARWALRGMHEALCDDLHGTGVHSCHVVFGKVSSAYFDHNPNSEEKIPRIARTVRTISPDDCAGVILRATERPRRQIIYPPMLRAYTLLYAIAPWATRGLLRRTGDSGTTPGGALPKP